MMQNMRWKTVFFYLFCAGVTSLWCHVAVDAQGEIKSNQKDSTRINTNFMKVNEKIDFLSEKIEALELNSSTGNHVISQILIALTELNKKSEELNKSNKEILKLIREDNQQNTRQRTTKGEVIDEMTSQCTSFCEAKINAWANETSDKFTEDLRVEKLDFNAKNSTFKTRVNACEPNPCSNGGQCELSSYRCTKCPYLTSGTHCENLKCNEANRCFQIKGTLYVVLHEKVTWDEAYNKCRDGGMQLAMPKDVVTTEGVITQLKTMYPVHYTHLWIGLKSNGTKEFRWVDGTPLGAYKGGRADFMSRLGWTTVYLHGVKRDYWFNYPLGEQVIQRHYPLCERHISIRF